MITASSNQWVLNDFPRIIQWALRLLACPKILYDICIISQLHLCASQSQSGYRNKTALKSIQLTVRITMAGYGWGQVGVAAFYLLYQSKDNCGCVEVKVVLEAAISAYHPNNRVVLCSFEDSIGSGIVVCLLGARIVSVLLPTYSLIANPYKRSRWVLGLVCQSFCLNAGS